MPQTLYHREERYTHAKGSHRHTSNRHGMARRCTHSLFSTSIPYFHSGGDHQRAHGQGQDQRADRLNQWAARYSLFIISPIQRAIPMHGTATPSPCRDVDAGRRDEGRTRARCQGTTPYGDRLMVGHPARPLFFEKFKNRLHIIHFAQYINIYAINRLVNQKRKIL